MTRRNHFAHGVEDAFAHGVEDTFAHGAEDRAVSSRGAMEQTAAETMDQPRGSVGITTLLVGVYVVVVMATIVALAAMSAAHSDLATSHAWVHAGIVAVFAVVLPLRLRAANRGSRSGLRAVGIIAGVLLAANFITAAIPDLFPTWMRVEMIGIAVLMAATLASIIGRRR